MTRQPSRSSARRRKRGVGVESFVERADQQDARRPRRLRRRQAAPLTAAHRQMHVGLHRNTAQGSVALVDYNPAASVDSSSRNWRSCSRRYSPPRAVELLVRAALHDAAGVEHDDLVGVADGGEPVGDHQHRPLPHEPLDRLLHQPLRLGIERAGRFVEDEDRRIAKQGPGDGDPLALPAGEPGAPLAEQGVEPVGQLPDEGRRVGRLGRGLDLSPGWRPGEP